MTELPLALGPDHLLRAKTTPGFKVDMFYSELEVMQSGKAAFSRSRMSFEDRGYVETVDEWEYVFSPEELAELEQRLREVKPPEPSGEIIEDAGSRLISFRLGDEETFITVRPTYVRDVVFEVLWAFLHEPFHRASKGMKPTV